MEGMGFLLGGEGDWTKVWRKKQRTTRELQGVPFFQRGGVSRGAMKR